MKPDKPVARRGDYTFAQIEHADGAALIREHHYAKGCSKTGVMYARTKPYPRWVTKDGAQVSTKAGPKTRTAEEMRALGYEVAGHFWKHKFVYYFPT